MNAPANSSTLRLYQIADDYLTALEVLAALDDLPPEAIADTLEGLSGTFQDQAANLLWGTHPAPCQLPRQTPSHSAPPRGLAQGRARRVTSVGKGRRLQVKGLRIAGCRSYSDASIVLLRPMLSGNG
jgi:hypothetical protein